jgi:hypothetical protein
MQTINTRVFSFRPSLFRWIPLAGVLPLLFFGVCEHSNSEVNFDWIRLLAKHQMKTCCLEYPSGIAAERKGSTS